jgi:leader peptidase (prepilin peptidase) / N-methyltransferase
MSFQPRHIASARSLAQPALVFAALFLALAWPAFQWGVGAPSGRGVAGLGASLLLGATLVALSAIDWLTYRLPNALTLPLAIAGLIVHSDAGRDVLIEHGAAAIVGFAVLYGAEWIYRRWRGRVGLGLGDAKLFAAAGAWLGLGALASVMVWASVSALLAIGLLRLLGRPLTMTSRIAFGPWLAIAFWLVWLYGPIGG